MMTSFPTSTVHQLLYLLLSSDTCRERWLLTFLACSHSLLHPDTVIYVTIFYFCNLFHHLTADFFFSFSNICPVKLDCTNLAVFHTGSEHDSQDDPSYCIINGIYSFTLLNVLGANSAQKLKTSQILTRTQVHICKCVPVCEHVPTHTYTHKVERMERTQGAGVSFPMFIGKTPCERSQLSRPKLIQHFYKSLDRKRGVVLHFHFFSLAAQ